MSLVARLKGVLAEERGAIAVLMAAGMVSLFGFAAISVDAGRVYADRQRLHDVADVAALAGAAYLPDRTAAEAAALAQAADNGVNDGVVVSFPDPGSIEVRIDGRTDLFFAPILSSDLRSLNYHVASGVGAGGAAAVGPRRGNGGGGGGGHGGGGSDDDDRDDDGDVDWEDVDGGIVPLATEDGAYAYGEAVTLKVGPRGATSGNFHALALGGTGADVYRENLKFGYPDVVRIGQRFDTETGNMAGSTGTGVDWRIDLDPFATFETVQPGSPRLVIVPMVDSFDVNGRKEVEVKGFAAFFLEGANRNGEVTGRFLRRVIPGQPGGPDYGLWAVQLIR